MVKRWLDALVGVAPMSLTEAAVVVATGGLGLLALAQGDAALWMLPLAVACAFLLLRGLLAVALGALRLLGRALRRVRVPRVRIEWPEQATDAGSPALTNTWLGDPADLRSLNMPTEEMDLAVGRARIVAEDRLAPDPELDLHYIEFTAPPRMRYVARSRLAGRNALLWVMQHEVEVEEVTPFVANEHGELGVSAMTDEVWSSPVWTYPWHDAPYWRDLLMRAFYRARPLTAPIRLFWVDHLPQDPPGTTYTYRWVACIDRGDGNDRCYQLNETQDMVEFDWFRG